MTKMDDDMPIKSWKVGDLKRALADIDNNAELLVLDGDDPRRMARGYFEKCDGDDVFFIELNALPEHTAAEVDIILNWPKNPLSKIKL